MTPDIAAPVAVVPYWTYLIPIGIAFVGMIQVVMLAWINAKAKAALENTEDTKDATAKTAESVEQVHIAVNSERTEMIKKLEQLEDRILALSEDKARLEQSATDREKKS